MEAIHQLEYQNTSKLFAQEKDVRRRVLIVPEFSSNARSEEEPETSKNYCGSDLVISNFWQPNSGDLCFWAFNILTGDVFQFTTCASEKCRSWFVGNYVLEDGSVTYLVPVEPLFLAIPFLLTAKKKKMFQPLNQILAESESSAGSISSRNSLGMLVERADVFLRDLDLICLVKVICGQKFFKLSETKLSAWLKVKVRFLAKALEEEQVNVGSRVAVAGYARKEEAYTQDQFEKFAFGILCDYIPESLHKKLSSTLGINELSESKKLDSTVEKPSKKVKNDQEVSAAPEDYSKVFQRLNTASTQKKLSAGQKRLQKVDITGMKNISSYFTRSTSVPEKSSK